MIACHIFLAVAIVNGSFDESIATLRAVGPNGDGSAAAAKAWTVVASAEASQVPAILAAMDGANPVARNWLRSAIDQVCESTRRQGKSLPSKELEAFLRDTKHQPQARRLAYDLLVESDAKLADQFLPTLLDDPSLELRRDAVALVLEQAEKLSTDNKKDAVAKFQTALASARDFDQINRAAHRLRELGEPTDLAAHLGMIVEWKLIGPFPNAEQKGVNEVYPPERKIDFTEEMDGKNGKVKWTDFVSKDLTGLIDLNIGVGQHLDSVAYAAAEFHSDKAQDIEIRLGCFTAFKLFVNGKLVLDRGDAYTGMRLDHYVAKAHLQPGRNVILVKACQDDPPAPLPKQWRFMLRVCDAGGKAILSTTRKPT